MTTSTLARRVHALELAQRDDDVVTIAVEYVDLSTGAIVGRSPAVTLADWAAGAVRCVDYRTTIWEQP